MKVKYFQDTDTPYIEFDAGKIAETCDLDESTLLELDGQGRICALTMEHAGEVATKIELIRSTTAEKREQIDDVQAFQKARNHLAPSGETGHASAVDSADAPVKQVHDGHGLKYLQDTARERVRSPDASREDPLAGADQPCVVRRRRRVSAQHVMPLCFCRAPSHASGLVRLFR